MSNRKETAANTVMWAGGTSFVSGFVITFACMMYEASKQPTIPAQYFPYSLDFNSAAGSLHTSALLIGVVGVLFMLTGIYLSDKANSETQNSPTETRSLN